MTGTISDVVATHGSIDVLVNNAGYGLFGAIESIALEEARRQFEVNLFGAARLTQLVLPGMREKRAGKIINISSTNGKVYAPLTGWYTASKHALEGWSDCLRLEVRPFGIDVVIVEPGAIRTGFADRMLRSLDGADEAGPYVAALRRLEHTTRKNAERGIGSEPEVVARAVAAAVRSKRPRSRYAVGLAAKPMIWLRKHVSDRIFDRIMTAMN